MTLFDITADLLKLYEIAEDPEMDADVLKDTIEAVEGELEVKADGYAKVMTMLEGDSNTLGEEIKRLQERKKHIDNSQEKIKKNLEDAMRATGKTKIKTTLHNFSIAKNPASVKIDETIDINTISPEFIRWSAPEIDKDKVKKALKAGEKLEWAKLEQGESLRIK